MKKPLELRRRPVLTGFQNNYTLSTLCLDLQGAALYIVHTFHKGFTAESYSAPAGEGRGAFVIRPFHQPATLSRSRNVVEREKLLGRLNAGLKQENVSLIIV